MFNFNASFIIYIILKGLKKNTQIISIGKSCIRIIYNDLKCQFESIDAYAQFYGIPFKYLHLTYSKCFPFIYKLRLARHVLQQVNK